jgi:type I restriction enzyme S subunit
VEWKTLGKVLKYEQPSKYIVESTDYSNEGTPVLTAGESFILGYTDEVNGIYQASKDFPVIIFDDFTTSFHWVDFDFKVKSSAMKMLKPIDGNVNFRYVYYTMCTINYVPTEHTRQWIGTYSNFQIPLPPLDIQSRIVEILDHFTNLTANLTAELALRRKQFEHMLDVYFGINEESMIILASKKGIEIKELQNLGTLTRGRRFVRDDIRTKGVPCIHYGDMYTTYGIAEENTITFLDEEKANKLRFAEPNDVVIVGAGENDWDIGVGLAWFGKEKVVVHDACYIYKHSLNPKFVSYYLRSNNYHLQIRKWVSSGKISAISDKNLGKAKIPLYNADVQQTIVEQLDKFTALIQNIENELALRQKQYEYYREKLLSFPSPSL